MKGEAGYVSTGEGKRDAWRGRPRHGDRQQRVKGERMLGGSRGGQAVSDKRDE